MVHKNKLACRVIEECLLTSKKVKTKAQKHAIFIAHQSNLTQISLIHIESETINLLIKI